MWIVYNVWKWMSEEALNGMKMMYWEQNTNLFFRKRDDSAAGVFAPSNYACYSTHSTHTLSCNKAAIGLCINFHAGFIVIIVEWIWFGALTIMSNPSFILSSIVASLFFIKKVFCCAEVQGIIQKRCHCGLRILFEKFPYWVTAT
jgi:hypothetical protein